MADKKATLHVEGQAPVELPIMEGALGTPVIDVRTLGANGFFTFDPGFLATASCESQITFIDGGKGILLHRGYPIDQLANNADYLEVCYILLYGEAPTREQYEQFKKTVKRHTMVHEQIASFFHGFRRDAHPMAVMCGVVGAWLLFIMIHWISTTMSTAKLRLTVCCQKCRHWQQCATNTLLVSLSFTQETT